MHHASSSLNAQALFRSVRESLPKTPRGGTPRHVFKRSTNHDVTRNTSSKEGRLSGRIVTAAAIRVTESRTLNDR